MEKVEVVGGGLAGCEAALQLASRGFQVRLHEMRPDRNTPAHKTPYLGELVCSNSLKSENILTASGLLKKELNMLGCRLLELADKARVPAGHALAVDRIEYAKLVTCAVESEPGIDIVRSEKKDLDFSSAAIIATGPLTSDSMSKAIAGHLGEANLHFYDAISISVDSETVDSSGWYKASRYGKGGADYWNIPFDRQSYEMLVDYLGSAPKSEVRDFEETFCFDACLPAEVIVSRGRESLSFGPMKPRGLPDPSTGKEPYAVLQLRQETIDGTMLGLVGFQTRLTRPAQKKLLELIPGLGEAEILRYGSIHRNTYIDSPRLLAEGQMSRKSAGLFFAGQLTGVEGYVESIAHGLIVSTALIDHLKGVAPRLFPAETILGGLQRHLSGGKAPFQPMNANFGILPPAGGRKKARKEIKSSRAIDAMRDYLSSGGGPEPL